MRRALTGKTPRVWSDPNRKKVCFYGSLNLLNGGVTVTRTETMNSTTTAQHLEAVLASYPDNSLRLLWDRASWHGGAPVQEVLKLPVAAPDLNPQEQVWKATRRAVSHNHQFFKLPALADEFETHLTQTTFQTSMLEFHGYLALRPMFI